MLARRMLDAKPWVGNLHVRPRYETVWHTKSRALCADVSHDRAARAAFGTLFVELLDESQGKTAEARH